jgi:hypothetical protein
MDGLIWSLRLEIVSYIDLHDLYLLGCSKKSLFMLFLRERNSRKSPITPPARLPDFCATLLSDLYRFLGKGWKFETVFLSSYPRCGNSYLRKVLESITGIVTGTDSHPCRTLSASLIRSGYRVPHMSSRISLMPSVFVGRRDCWWLCLVCKNSLSGKARLCTMQRWKSCSLNSKPIWRNIFLFSYGDD